MGTAYQAVGEGHRRWCSRWSSRRRPPPV